MKKYYFVILLLQIQLVVLAQNAQDFILMPSLPTEEELASFPILDESNILTTHDDLIYRAPQSSMRVLELYTPPVRSQGRMGSCSSWAACYAAGSIIAYEKYGIWSDAMRSPSYLFNQYRDDYSVLHNCDSVKCTLHQILNGARTQGVCSYSIMPYNSRDCNTLPNNEQKFDAHLNTFSSARLSRSDSVALFKSLLSKGYPVIVDFYVYSSFYTMWDSDGIWSENEHVDYKGSHAACIVGYNDELEMFKVQNSWGTSGGDHGFFWITYDLIESGCLHAAFVITDISPDVYPTLMGPSRICSHEEFLMSNLPSSATVNWSYSTAMNANHPTVTISTTSDSTALYTVTFRSDNIVASAANTTDIGGSTGTDAIYATVTLGDAQLTFQKDVSYHKNTTPVIQTYPLVLTVNSSRTFTETACSDVDADSIYWVVNVPGRALPVLGHGRSITVRPTAPGTLIVAATNKYGCAPNNTTIRDYLVVSRGFSLSQESDGNIGLQVESQNEEEAEYTWIIRDYQMKTIYECHTANVFHEVSKSLLHEGMFFVSLYCGDVLIDNQVLILKNK